MKTIGKYLIETRGTIECYATFYSDREEDIKELENRIEELKEEYGNDWWDISYEFEKEIKPELEWAKEEQKIFDEIYDKFDSGTSIEIDNIGRGVSSYDDWNYFGLEIDAVNGIVIARYRDRVSIAEDKHLPVGLIVELAELGEEEAIEYMYEHEELFDKNDFEIIEEE